MSIRFAFAGFRHGHINDLYRRVGEREGTEVVAACEEHAETREKMSGGPQKITHTNVEEMLSDVGCDVIAIGDYYARRGELAIRALEAGKHVIVDKPLCTRLDEVDMMARMSEEKGLRVGCMLTMRDHGQTLGMRQLIQEGAIGEVHAIGFGGQHPLSYGSRPRWYFEPGKHGGTINDIGIHAIDTLPWMTGLQFSTVKAARCWNAFEPEAACFKDGAQMMLTMENGCGVMGDVSYFMPDKAGYSLPLYWRYTIWGREGVIETCTTNKEIRIACRNSEEMETRPLPDDQSGGYLEAFLKDIAGEAEPGERQTSSVLQSARTVLMIQKAADENLHDLDLT
jgi:predicted dehydrogenase